MILSLMPTLLARELIALAAQRRTYVLRTLYALGLFALVIGLSYRQLSALNAGDFGVLGAGGQLFDALMMAQFAGIYLFLPVLVAPLITDEDEHGNLDLLLVSGISPLAFLMQKLLSRLIGMGSYLLLALPIGGIALSLGGVDERQLIAGSLALALCCLQVGTMALWCSARATTSLRALGAAYLLGPLLLFIALPLVVLVPMLAMGALLKSHGIGMVDDAFIVPTSFYQAAVKRRYGLLDMVIASLPMLVSALGFCWLAWRALRRRRTTMSRQMRQQMRIFRPERIFERRRRQRVVAMGADGRSLPGDHALAWREIRRTPGFRAEHLHRLWLGLPMLAMFSMFFAYIDHERLAGGDQAGLLPGLMQCFYPLAIPIIAVLAAGLISGERLRHSLEILLVTPLSSRDLLREKLAGCDRLVWTLLVVIGYLAVLMWLVEVQHGSVAAASLRLAATVITALVYLRLAVWLALALSLRLRAPTPAAVTILGLIVAWCVLPLLAVAVYGDLSHQDLTQGWQRFLILLSPAGMVLGSQSDHPPALDALAINTLGYGAWWWLVRHDSLRRADRLLGRAG